MKTLLLILSPVLSSLALQTALPAATSDVAMLIENILQLGAGGLLSIIFYQLWRREEKARKEAEQRERAALKETEDRERQLLSLLSGTGVSVEFTGGRYVRLNQDHPAAA